MVRRRGDGWQADVIIDGKRVRRQFDTEFAARAFEAEHQLGLVSPAASPLPILGSAGVVTLATSDRPLTLDALREYVYATSWCRQKDGERSNEHAKEVCGILGADRNILTLGLTDVDRLIMEYSKRSYSNATINRRVAIFSKMVNDAYKRRWVASALKYQKLKEEKGRIRVYTPEEEQAILDACDQLEYDDLKDMVIILLDTGMRLGEASKLRRHHVTSDAVDLDGEVTKSCNYRQIPLTPRAKEVLDLRTLAMEKGQRTIFGEPAWHFDKLWAKVRAVLGQEHDEDFVPHSCRHTFITRLIMAGVPLPVVQKLAGHSTILVTMRYTHPNKKDLVDAIARYTTQVKDGTILGQQTQLRDSSAKQSQNVTGDKAVTNHQIPQISDGPHSQAA